jgi:hypothetical protein
VLDRYLPQGWHTPARVTDPETWKAVESIPDAELWDVRRAVAKRMAGWVRSKTVTDRLTNAARCTIVDRAKQR